MKRALEVSLAAGLLVFLLGPQVEARPITPYPPERIAKEAEVIVVGEVVEVREVGAIPAEETRWRAPLRQMRADVNVLRRFPDGAGTEPAVGGTVAVPYEVIAPGAAMPPNGPDFPQVSVGDVFAFPLREPDGNGEARWELIAEEDFGLLVPCVKTAVEAPRDTGVQFLVAELAGTFALGGDRDLHKAAGCVQWWDDGDAGSVRDLAALLAEVVGEGDARWTRIFVATYCRMGTPRPTIQQLAGGETGDRPVGALAGAAFGHIREAGRDERLIEAALAYAATDPWGTAVMLREEYPAHPTAVRLMTEALEAGKPGTLYLAHYLIREEDHPLIPAAVQAATVFVRADDAAARLSDLGGACALIRDYGSDAQFGVLLREFERARDEDREKYRWLWQSCAYVESPRLVPIIRIVIEDRGALSGDFRFCDAAAFELQRVTGVDFGLAGDNTPAEREDALERARAWLAGNPQ